MKYIACTLFVQLILSSVLHAQIADFAGTDFDVADSIADQYPNHSPKDLAALANKLTRSLPTEQQKFRAIFKWVCDNIDNDYGLYLKNKHQRERLKDSNALNIWNKKISHKVIKDLIDQHTTICTGYAYLIRELSICAGLDCKVIDGYGRNVQSNIGGDGILNHSWNAIRLNDKWYLCDATWSAGSYDMKNSMYTRKFDDAYFLSDPTFFVLKHYPVDSAWILLMKKPTLRMFLDGPIVYLAALQYKVLPIAPSRFDTTTTKGTEFAFQFTTSGNKVPDKFELQVQRSNTSDTVSKQLLQGKSLPCSINHLFSERGVYDVHILLDDHYTFSYKVTVE